MIIEERAYARAGLVGNPSDIFHGKTMSLLFDRFEARVVLYQTPELVILPNERDQSRFRDVGHLLSYRRQYGYYGGIRLIEATIMKFLEHCRKTGVPLAEKNFTIEYSSTIPFGVGLGGSSAIARAVLAALMGFYGLSDRDIPNPIQANLILEAETDELDISAGPQDRVVIVYGGLVYMDFTEEAYAENAGVHGNYEKLDGALLPPLFIAYKQELSKSSGKVHNIMRYRAQVEHDSRVLEAMRKKAELVDEAKEALLRGDKEALGPILSRDFDLRRSVYTISPENLLLIEIARELGAHAKQTGSGGAAIGTYRDEDHLRKLSEAYASKGFTVFKVNLADYAKVTG
jgi:glucuronokinase